MNELTANELRLNNLVYKIGLDYIGDNPIPDRDNIETVKVDLNVLQNIINFNGTTNLDLYEPIPLSEEILLKCGFEKSNIDKDNAWLNKRYRFLNFSSDESVDFKKVYLSVNKMDIICDYLHQLQNLYFALTNQELNIEL